MTLYRKFRSVERDLIYAERLLEARKILPQTNAYPGFGASHSIFKTRVVNTDVSKGKSSGYRLIYEEIETEGDMVILLILLYGKSTYKEESDVRIEIRTRLGSPEYSQQVQHPA